MRQNIVARFVPLPKCCLCSQAVAWRRTGPVLVTRAGCRPWSCQCISPVCRACFSRCDGFSGIQKAVVDQTGSRPPVTMTFSGAGLALGRALELLSPTTELVTAGCCIKSTFHHTSQRDREMARCCLDLRQHFKMTIF